MLSSTTRMRWARNMAVLSGDGTSALLLEELQTPGLTQVAAAAILVWRSGDKWDACRHAPCDRFQSAQGRSACRNHVQGSATVHGTCARPLGSSWTWIS